MTGEELFTLIEKLRAAGITHFKQGDLELSFSDKPTLLPPAAKNPEPVSLEIPPSEPEVAPPHIVQEMRSLLRLSDEDLIDRIFPIPQQSDEDEVYN